MKHTEEHPTIEQRVDNGFEALDRVGPVGWREWIDLKRLDVGSADHCVIAQLTGPAGTRVGGNGTVQSSLYNVVTNGEHQDTWRYGLIWGPVAVVGDPDDDIRELNDEWRRRLGAEA